jgi:hypothetical protein
MRVSILLAGGMLVLGACSTSVEPRTMTLAERTSQCERVRAATVPTGRQTGNARNDYQCRSAHAPGYRPSNAGATAARSGTAGRTRY